MQLAKFPHMQLVAVGWYFDCSRGFVPDVEKSFYNSLIISTIKEIELEEEPEEDNPAPPSNENEVALVKCKGRNKKVVAHASSKVCTCSFRNDSIQCIVALATTVVGSPTTTTSAPTPDLVAASSHSSATIPSVPRKRKAITPDTSTTPLKRSFSLLFLLRVWT